MELSVGTSSSVYHLLARMALRILVWIDAGCSSIDFSFSQVFKLNCESQEEKGHRISDSPGWSHRLKYVIRKHRGLGRLTETPVLSADSRCTVLRKQDSDEMPVSPESLVVYVRQRHRGEARPMLNCFTGHMLD